jgi:CrcB protein
MRAERLPYRGVIRFFLICFAGAIGSGVRYLVGAFAKSLFSATFPTGTLAVNLAGSFLMVAILEVALHRKGFPETLRLVLTTGFLGGLTTYSAFDHETLEYLRAGAFGAAAAYVLATLLGCFFSGLAGVWVGRRFRP